MVFLSPDELMVMVMVATNIEYLCASWRRAVSSATVQAPSDGIAYSSAPGSQKPAEGRRLAIFDVVGGLRLLDGRGDVLSGWRTRAQAVCRAFLSDVGGVDVFKQREGEYVERRRRRW